MFKIGYMVFLVKMGALTPPLRQQLLIDYPPISALRASRADAVLFTLTSADITS
jgi:hypothetical protein